MSNVCELVMVILNGYMYGVDYLPRGVDFRVVPESFAGCTRDGHKF